MASGWNDPPLMSYSVMSARGSRKPNLTKRVLFPNPMASNTNIQDKPPTLPVFLPPTVIDNASTSVTRLAPHEAHTTDKVTDLAEEQRDRCSENILGAEEMFEQIVDIVNQCLSGLSTLQNNADFGRRIELFSRMWNTGKLSGDVQRKMHQCSLALQSGDYNKAESIHLVLMIDYCNQVSPWMVAIKHLIRESMKRELDLSSDEKKDSCASESICE